MRSVVVLLRVAGLLLLAALAMAAVGVAWAAVLLVAAAGGS